MKKQSQVTERTRQKLISSFWGLYKENDLNKITISNICKNAEYERTTFYRYFNDINDILNQLENEIIGNIKESIKSKSHNENRIVYEGFKRFNEKYGEYICFFFEKADRRFYIKFKELVKNEVYGYFNFNIKEESRKDFLYEFLFSSIIGSYICWYKNQDIMTLESFVTLANEMILNGSQTILGYTKKTR